MEAIYASLIGVGGTGLIAIITAFASGRLKLISGARLTKVEVEGTKWRDVAVAAQEQVRQQTNRLERQQLVVETTNSVLEALHVAAKERSSGATLEITNEVP